MRGVAVVRRWVLCRHAVGGTRALPPRALTIPRPGRDLSSFSSTTHKDTHYVTADCDDATGALIPPLHFSTTFERDDKGELSRGDGHIYSRCGNPTRAMFENTFTKLELGGGESLAFSSGMQAATALLMACPRAHVLLPDDLYHGIFQVVADVLVHWGMTMEKVDFTDHKAVQSCMETHRKTCVSTSTPRKLVIWLETPSNPQCKVTDIESICNMANEIFSNKTERTVVVDSTWATPYLLNPLELGADYVLHSVTKYIGGHSDLLAGIVTASKTEVDRAVSEASNGTGTNMLSNLRTVHGVGGGVCGPFEAWLALRGLRTLPVRLNHQCQSALKIATALEELPGVQRVFYPGLPSHPQHLLATAQMKGRYGGMLSFLVQPRSIGGVCGDGGEEALRISREVRLFKAATSLGGTESLIEHRRSVEGEHPVSPPNLLRLSVGLESCDDLIRDLTEAIENATQS